MTTKDRESFYEKLKRYSMYSADVYDEAPGHFKSIPCYAVSDVDTVINELTDESSIWQSYQEDYLKACDMATKLNGEVKELKEVCKCYEEENKRLRIIVKTLEFAYGRKLEVGLD